MEEPKGNPEEEVIDRKIHKRLINMKNRLCSTQLINSMKMHVLTKS